ncbi:hypothetical protein ACUY29_11360 [Corynebacterium aurimucosum]
MNDREKYEYSIRHALNRASDAKEFEKVLSLVCYQLEDLRLTLDLARGNREHKAIAWATLERLANDMDSLKLGAEEELATLKAFANLKLEEAAAFSRELE